MTKNDVKLCMLDLNNKKREGFDRIPVCAMYDAREPYLIPWQLFFQKFITLGNCLSSGNFPKLLTFTLVSVNIKISILVYFLNLDFI